MSMGNEFTYPQADLPPAEMLDDPRAQIGELVSLDIKMRRAFAGDPMARQRITNPAAAIGLSNIHPDTLSALVQVQAAAIRWTVDGTTPTATVGFHSDVNDLIKLTGLPTIQAFQVINEGAGAASLEVVLFD